MVSASLPSQAYFRVLVIEGGSHARHVSSYRIDGRYRAAIPPGVQQRPSSPDMLRRRSAPLTQLKPRPDHRGNPHPLRASEQQMVVPEAFRHGVGRGSPPPERPSSARHPMAKEKGPNTPFLVPRRSARSRPSAASESFPVAAPTTTTLTSPLNSR